MHILIEFLFAIVFGILLTLIFRSLFRRPGPWARGIVFFLVVFLAAWVGGVWIAPFGPALFGSYWLPFLLAGLFMALILAAAMPRSEKPKPPKGMEEPVTRENYVPAARFDIFFYILIGGMLVAIVLGYVLPG